MFELCTDGIIIIIIGQPILRAMVLKLRNGASEAFKYTQHRSGHPVHP